MLLYILADIYAMLFLIYIGLISLQISALTLICGQSLLPRVCSPWQGGDQKMRAYHPFSSNNLNILIKYALGGGSSPIPFKTTHRLHVRNSPFSLNPHWKCARPLLINCVTSLGDKRPKGTGQLWKITGSRGDGTCRAIWNCLESMMQFLSPTLFMGEVDESDNNLNYFSPAPTRHPLSQAEIRPWRGHEAGVLLCRLGTWSLLRIPAENPGRASSPLLRDNPHKMQISPPAVSFLSRLCLFSLPDRRAELFCPLARFRHGLPLDLRNDHTAMHIEH